MSELPVVILVPDECGDVETAAERLRDTGLRNPMVQVRSLDDLAARQRVHPMEMAFLIVHADICREFGGGDAGTCLPVYPAFAVETVDRRLMASIWLSPDAAATPPVPFDAPAVVRSLQRLGLRWLVI